jgi:hypothetical protein
VSNRKMDIPTTRAKNHAPVRPSADMWDKLDAIRASISDPPPNTFNAAQFAERYDIPYATAVSRVRALVKLGKIASVGKFGQGHTVYYRIADDIDSTN